MATRKMGPKMCLIKSIFLLCVLNYVSGKSHTKSLTESMGQEVIEIAAPIKELPQELEEEPSAEVDNGQVTTTTVQPATKKDFNKTPSDPSKKVKDIDLIDGRRQEDDEARIEKELADIYKDSLDYKADSAEVTKEVNISTSSAVSPTSTEPTASEDIDVSAPENALRSRNEFKFQPDSNNPRDILKFRTSIDEISCDNKLSATKAPGDDNTSAGSTLVAEILLWNSLIYLF